MPDMEFVRLEVADGVATLRLDRPKMNALNVQVQEEIRAAALEACAFLIDWTKTRAPFWKQELFADGVMRWVEARPEDDVAAAAWDSSAEHGRP